ncbi:arylesterase [Thioalkalivibrio versutus]|uniref:Arylesterase n=1 Tax=Thioalkalivibrio versutus TaxID=106634 RepID=A0A0G3G1J9_9GAMM|nr:arylesterase [Thioalkalivibrio versutus]AKJ95103.1 arylesterase [Thioalkalivibrio versutus]
MLRIPLVVMGLIALLWSPVAAANSLPDENRSAEPLRVLVFGDSLSAAYGMPDSASWPALLGERLAEREKDWKVVNVSISGDTTAGGRSRLPDVLERAAFEVVILALGGNDGLRGLPPQAMRENLEAMVDAIEAVDANTLLLGIRIPPNYGRRYTERFEAVFADLAEERGLAFEPFFLEDILLEDGMLMDDGIHPSEAAQPHLLDAVWSRLEPMVEEAEARSRPCNGAG